MENFSNRKLKLSFGGYSRAGIKFENQDAFAAFQPRHEGEHLKGAVVAIADGVSSSKQAKLAATTCVTSFISDYLETPETWSVKRSVSKILKSLNAWCYAQGCPELSHQSDMLTTLSCAVFKSTTMHYFHVGDTRIYRLQDGELEQLTRDHKQIQGRHSYLSRAIGIDPHLEVDSALVPLRENDIFLFTTDGIHDFLEHKKLRQLMMAEFDSLEHQAKAIMDEALQAGSDDNVSCLLASIDTLPNFSIDECFQRLQALAIPPPLEPGMKLEQFEVLSVLFNGTRSYVYKVKDLRDNKVYALKAPSHNYADELEYLWGFAQEEWVGLRLQHNNVMQVYRRPQDSQFLYHICEYIDGQTLRQWIIDNPKPQLDQVRKITNQVIDALRALQRMDMTYRDLKPDNLMMTVNGDIKLIDFGTVGVAGLSEVQSPLEENVPVGSVNYVAPEYRMTLHSDHCSDIFSLGVLCYELLCGKLPFKPFAYKDYLPKDYSEWQYQSICLQRKDIPRWVDAALKKATQPNPNYRYVALSEFATDIHKPNKAIVEAIKKAPLLERNPLLFWQMVALFMLLLNLFQLYWNNS